MPIKPRPLGLQPRINATNPLSRGLVFAWAPGWGLFDFTKGRPLTLSEAVGNGSQYAGRYTRNRYLFDSPVSSGDVSFLLYARQYTTNDRISFGAINLAGWNEHLNFSGQIFVGPFADSRWLTYSHSEAIAQPYTYSGSLASGVTNGTKIWINDKLAGTTTRTTSFPSQVGIGRGSSNSATWASADDVYVVLVWNRALSDSEMTSVRQDPWQVLAQAPVLSRIIPAIYTTAAAPEITLTGNGVAFTDGDATVSFFDKSHFGAVALNGSPRSHTFVIGNTGSGLLTIDDVEVPTGFVITSQPTSVAASGTANLVIRLDADVVGDKSGDLIVYSDDADEPAFDIAIKGTVYPPSPSPFTYPTFPAPNTIEDTQTIGGSDYDFVDGQAFAEGTYVDGTTAPLSTIYTPHFYWDNYVVTGGVLYRIASPSNAAVRATLTDDFEGAATLPDLIYPSGEWTALTLQEAAAPTGQEAVDLGNLVIANGEGEFIVNRVEPDGTRFHTGTQSLRVFCEAGGGVPSITKASLATGLLHFTAGQHFWAQFWVYIEDGTPLGIFDLECTYQLNSPGLRLLLDGSLIPRIQLKSGDNPDLDGTNPIPADEWVKIKLHFELNNTSGVVQMWVNDALEIDGTMKTLPLPSSVYDRVQIGVTANSVASSVLLYIDDINIQRSEQALNTSTDGGGYGIVGPQSVIHSVIM